MSSRHTFSALVMVGVAACTGGLPAPAPPVSAEPPSADHAACAARDGAACERLVDAIVAAGGQAARLTEVRALLDRTCAAGSAGACVGLGRLALPGEEVFALALFVRGCTGGVPHGCEQLGVAYEQGRGVPVDAARAAPLYRSACDGGALSACVRLARLVEAQSPADAAALLARGCDGGEREGCEGLAAALALGLGVPRDEARARALYEATCSGGSPGACAALGGIYARGDGVPRDEARAAELLRRACARQHPRGCRALATVLASAAAPVRDEPAALALFTRACDQGDATACAQAGGLLAAGRGAVADLTRAADLWRRACDGANALGCGRLGVAALIGRGAAADPERGRALLQKACDGGQAASCDVLGMAYASGNGAPRDDARAEGFFRTACELGSPTGCSRLGLCYLRGPTAGAASYDFGIARAAADCRHTALACDWLGGVPSEAATAAFSVLVDTCDAEIPAACGALARAIAAGHVPREAASAALGRIRGACDQGKMLWCRRLAYWHEHGLSVPRSLPLARGYYRKACEAGDARACTDLGRMLATGAGGERSERAAVAIFRTTCEGSRDGFVACGHLGMLLLGRSADAERAEGAALLERACEGADALACYRLGGFYATGSKGFPRDDRRAVELLERACTEGGQACAEARAMREKLGVDL